MPAATRVLLTAVCALLVLLAPAAAARADDGPVDPRGADVTAALGLAQQQWGIAACSGVVDVRWTAAADVDLNAVSSWSTTGDLRTAPQRTTNCVIALNPRASWDWPKLCTVLVHEAGHLLGHDHAEGGVMSAVYGAPLAACAATPEPQGAFAPAPAPAPAAVAVAAPAAPAAAPLPVPAAAPSAEEDAAPRSAVAAAAETSTPVSARAGARRARRSGRAGQRRGRGARRSSPRAARTR